MDRHIIIAISLAVAAGVVSWAVIGYVTPQPSTLQSEGQQFDYEIRTVEIGDTILDVEIADDNDKITQGLMFRDPLQPNRGMLFVFNDTRQWQFWTMNMKFSIDMVWLDADGKVVYIVENAEPCIDAAHASSCTFSPDEPASYVLEVNAGFVQEHNITEGSVMRFLT